jgi:hypothetical protein
MPTNYDNINTGNPVEERYPNDFLVPGFDFHTHTIDVKLGESWVRGQVIAYETASSKYVAYDSAGSGGAEIPVEIAVEDVDATAEAVSTQSYDKGVFNKRKLTLSNSGDSVDDYTFYKTLKQNQILIIDSQE